MTYSNNGIVIAGIAAGFVVIPLLANVNATIINGFLILLLIGIVLYHSSTWMPLLTQFGAVGSSGAQKSGAKTPSGTVTAGGTVSNP